MRMSRLYRRVKNCAADCSPPEGVCVAEAWAECVDRWCDECPEVWREALDGRVSGPTIGIIYSGSTGYLSFCRAVGSRIIGAMGDTLTIRTGDSPVLQVDIVDEKVVVTHHPGVRGLIGDDVLGWLYSHLRVVAADRDLGFTAGADAIPFHTLATLPNHLHPWGVSACHSLWARECAGGMSIWPATDVKSR